MSHPEAASHYDTRAVLAHRLFLVAMQGFDVGIADPTGDVTIAHLGGLDQVSPQDVVVADPAISIPDEEPSMFVVVRRRPRMESVETLSSGINDAVLGERPAPFARRGPSSIQQRIEVWAGRGRGLRGWIGRTSLAKRLSYDEGTDPLVATEPLAQRTLLLNEAFGEIVPPGGQPAYNYSLTLFANRGDSTQRQSEINLTWLSHQPYIGHSDRELAERTPDGTPRAYSSRLGEVPMARIAEISAVVLQGARVLAPDYALELRQRGPLSSIMGTEAAGMGEAADFVLSNVLGVSSRLVADIGARLTMTHLIPAASPDAREDGLGIHRVTVVERAGNTTANMHKHLRGDDTNTARSVITDIVLGATPETSGDLLKVRVENVYDLHTGRLITTRAHYGVTPDTIPASKLPFGDANVRGVRLSRDRRFAIHAAIEQQLRDGDFQTF